MDYLDLVPEPDVHNIIDISEKVECSERHVYTALRRLREKRMLASKEISVLDQLRSTIDQVRSDMFFLYSVAFTFIDGDRKLTGVERRRLTKIENELRELGFEVDDE